MVSKTIKGGVTLKTYHVRLPKYCQYRWCASDRILYRWEKHRYIDYERCRMCNEEDEYYAQAINMMNT
jgi:hypothetical protein